MKLSKKTMSFFERCRSYLSSSSYLEINFALLPGTFPIILKSSNYLLITAGICLLHFLGGPIGKKVVTSRPLYRLVHLKSGVHFLVLTASTPSYVSIGSFHFIGLKIWIRMLFALTTAVRSQKPITILKAFSLNCLSITCNRLLAAFWWISWNLYRFLRHYFCVISLEIWSGNCLLNDSAFGHDTFRVVLESRVVVITIVEKRSTPSLPRFQFSGS